MLAKDRDGGIVEHLTVLVLLPGIAAGAVAVLRHRRAFPEPWVAAWVATWTAACIYFAGEEISWGQWIFGWETPEAMEALNDQGETNLHNMSSWLDQKPRALVETWIVVGGLLLPVLRRVRGVTPASILSTSTCRSVSSTSTGVAPDARAEMRYIENPWRVWMTSAPGPP